MSSLWFSSEVYFMSKVYTLFIPNFTEIADNQMIISYSISREWVLNHIFKSIDRNSKENKYCVNQHFANLRYSHKFLKNLLFCRFGLPFGYPNQDFLLPL